MRGKKLNKLKINDLYQRIEVIGQTGMLKGRDRKMQKTIVKVCLLRQRHLHGNSDKLLGSERGLEGG